MVEADSIIEALRLGRYERVSVQVHDSHLASGPELVERIQSVSYISKPSVYLWDNQHIPRLKQPKQSRTLRPLTKLDRPANTRLHKDIVRTQFEPFRLGVTNQYLLLCLEAIAFGCLLSRRYAGIAEEPHTRTPTTIDQ